MNETLEIDRMRGAAYATYVVERQRTFEYYARKAAPLQKGGILLGHAPRLCRGVQFDRKVHLPQGHVLHDKRIDISRDKFARRRLRRRQLVLKDDGIQRGIESRPVTVGIFGGTGNILDAVGGGTARPEAGTAHIDGIRSVVYGRHGRLQILCRSQQFDTSHHNSFYAAKILTFVSKEIRRGKKKK